jgi:arylsulfatase A-like enzyme
MGEALGSAESTRRRTPMNFEILKPSLLVRSASVGVLTGLLFGLYEATYLWRHPYPEVLLKPTVTCLIWFLAPLLDGMLSGVVGLGTGAVIAACQGNLTWHHAIRFVGAHRIVAMVLVAALAAANALIGGAHAFGTLKLVAVFLVTTAASRLLRPLPLRTLGITLGTTFLVLLAGVAFYTVKPSAHATVAAAGPEPPRPKPDIILITLDTVRADHLSSYGYSRLTTPNLDRVAREGVLFENAIAPTSWTLASHASMFTGSLPHQHGADWHSPLNTSRWTLADALKAEGYETVGFTANIDYGEAGWGLGEGFDLYEDNRPSLLHNLRVMKVGLRVFDPFYQRWLWPDYFERRDASKVNQDVLGWFHRRSPHPVFLFINYFDVHDPYLPPRDYAHEFGDAPPELIRKTKFVFSTRGTVHLATQERNALVSGYDNSLASLDHALGELLNSLSRHPQWQNTVVIITSDHGEGFGEHGTYGHGSSLYREELRVPLIVFGPQIPKGLRIPQVVSTQNLFSTALEFAGEGVMPVSPAALQRYWTPGIDPGKLDESTISELTPKNAFTWVEPEMSLRTQDWEYLRDSQGKEELYHWKQDPGEQVNLAASAGYQPIVEALHARLCTLISDSRRPWQGPQYLSALDEPRRPFVNVAASLAKPLIGQRVPCPCIGDAQDRFPPKTAIPSGMLQAPDRDLLQSLPYH